MAGVVSPKQRRGIEDVNRIPGIITITHLRRVAPRRTRLPRVDAIGGSSAGIIVDNEIRVASLLRAISKKDFPEGGEVFSNASRKSGTCRWW